jgi:hypothetical protein
MLAFSPFLFDSEIAGRLLADADGNIRGALVCWGIALSAFIVFRIPRPALLACLFAATVTVGFAARLVEAVPVQATFASAKPSSPPPYQPLQRRPVAQSAGEAAN